MAHDLNLKKIYTSMIFFFVFFAKSKKLYFEFFGGIIPKMRFFPKDPTLSIFSLKAT